MHDAYQQMPGINISRLLALQESPAAFKYALDHPGADSPAKALGRLVHTILLEPEKVHAGYVLKAYPDYRTKDAQAWKAEQEKEGRTIYTLEEFEQAEVMAANALDNPDIADLVGAADAIKEGAIQWTDKDIGVDCKGRFDLLAGGVLADIKTTQDVTPTGFFRECLKYNTFCKMAWYQDGVEAHTGGLYVNQVLLIAIKNKPPYSAVCYEVPRELLADGRQQYKFLLQKYRDCLDLDYWPGIADRGIVRLTAPAWYRPTTNFSADAI
jgi:hypothetical protein